MNILIIVSNPTNDDSLKFPALGIIIEYVIIEIIPLATFSEKVCFDVYAILSITVLLFNKY